MHTFAIHTSLRARILLATTTLLVVVLGLLYIAASQILSASLQQLELRQIRVESQRAVAALEEQQRRLKSVIRDWAWWDDTYLYVQGLKPEFAHDNLNDLVYSNYDLDLQIYSNSKGEILYAQRRLADETLQDWQAESVQALTVWLQQRVLHSGAEVSSGVILLENKPFLFAAAPIFNSQVQGTEQGVLLMGYWLTEQRLQRLEQRLQLKLHIHANTTPLQEISRTEEVISAYMPLVDTDGKPVAILEVSEPRWIQQQAVVSRQYLLWGLLLTIVCSLGLLFWVMQSLILRRLHGFEQVLQRLALFDQGTGTLPPALPIQGDDELDRLALTLNVLLSNLNQSNQKLRHDALHDPLTGLGNRALFAERTQHALHTLHRYPDHDGFAVLLLDLDRFKLINDSQGHAAGDALLCSVAQRMQRVLREVDTSARLGGDEFAILLTAIQSPEQACHLAGRLLKVLSEPLQYAQYEIRTSASIGIVLYHPHYQDADQMLRDADIAMYRAKQRGKNGFSLFDQAMHAQVMRRLELEQELHHALDRHELQVYYQPLINLKNLQLAGFEALITWPHPQRGVIEPREFLPIAEETGLIAQIDLWVLEQTIRDLKQWRANYPDLRPLLVSINLSACNLQLPAFLYNLVQVMAQQHLLPDRLRLEITEGALLHDDGSINSALNDLRHIGVGLSLDDFGTGYSSLGRLEKLPLDALKIDSSLISQLDKREAPLSEAIIHLAHSLGVKVVAEGIETASQLRRLRHLGCDYGQGFYFAAALPPSALHTWLTRGSAPLAVDELNLSTHP